MNRTQQVSPRLSRSVPSSLPPAPSANAKDREVTGEKTVGAVQGPSHLTILPTYRCTAACRQCCFESSPHLRGGIPTSRLLEYIDEAARDFPSLKLVVFSGGECFLLKKDLDRLVSRAAQHGLATRCVTNGYWATSRPEARRRILGLYEAGLSELNFSTGDEHQAYVPFDRVALGATAAAELGIRTAIVIEGSNESRFGLEDALRHPDLVAFRKQHADSESLEVMTNIWIPFREDARITQPEEIHRAGRRASRSQGCGNILENMVITPSQQLASCCGLTFEHIDEMKLGDLRAVRMRDLYESQLDDFIKIWIRVEGPEEIFRFATQKDPTIPAAVGVTHPCQACAGLFLNPQVREMLRIHHREKVAEILFRYRMLRELESRVSSDGDPATTDRDRHLGFGA